MRISELYKRPGPYWSIQFFLIGPLIVLWGGVAYWFGFASEVLMKLVFPRRLGPLLLIMFLGAALAWTGLHLKSTPAERQITRAVDILLCVFVLFSILLLAGQVMSV